MSKLFDLEVFPDRPWKGRGYGRIRLDESLAKDLRGILRDEVRRRVAELRESKVYSLGTDQEVYNLKLALKRANTLRDRVSNLITEQGWDDATEIKAGS